MILGITGKCGVGKHTVGQYFEQREWKLLDADKIAHKLYRPYQRVWRAIVDRFGEEVLTTNDIIDRQKLRAIIFAGTHEAKKALQDLNHIVHPELKRYLKDEIYYFNKKEKNVVIVAALWKELSLFDLCDKVLLVKAGDALAFDRVKKRDGTDFNHFEAVCNEQSEPENPDFIVTNETDFKGLYMQLNEIMTQL